MSLFDTEDQQCQFVADFIEGFRPHEEVLLHLIVDESDIFAPQIPKSPLCQRSLDAMNQLTRRFRYKGMGTTLITQRPAELHKSVLGQIDLLFALRVVSPQDVNALDEWIKRNASTAERTQFLATLSGLPTGTAWVWSPRWLQLFRQVTIRTRKTYDSSATPKVGVKRVAPKQIAEIDLTHLSEQMSALFEKARATDPVLLQARIKELQEELHRIREERPRSSRGSSDHAQKDSARAIEALSLQVRQLEKEKEALQAELSLVRRQLREKGEQIVALQSVMSTQQASVVVGSVDAAPASLTPGEDPLQRLLYSEKKSLANLISLVQRLSVSEKTLCIWLLEHDEQEISSQELADAVSLDISVTWSRSTEKLVKLPFIKRKGKTKFYYHSPFA